MHFQRHCAHFKNQKFAASDTDRTLSRLRASNAFSEKTRRLAPGAFPEKTPLTRESFEQARPRVDLAREFGEHTVRGIRQHVEVI